MDKITTFMRVTKKRKAQEHDPKAMLVQPGKPVVVVEKPAKGLAPPQPPASPLKKHKTSVETHVDGELFDNGIHIPTFIFDSVKYTRKGAISRRSPTEQTIVDYIQEHYAIPDDFETSHRFGPHSGTTYDARLMRAYKLKQLQPLRNKQPPAMICISCAAIGHSDRDCPDGF